MAQSWKAKVLNHLVAGLFLAASVAALLQIVWPFLEGAQPLEERIFSESELAKHDGTKPGMRILLAIFGEVFDVTDGKRFYGAKSMSEYRAFAGRDASRLFVTGEWDAKLSSQLHDVSGISNADLKAIDDWRHFYRDHEDYVRLGVVYMEDGSGYYDKTGKPTEALKTVWRRIDQQRKVDAENAELAAKFPNCNSHWEQDKGGSLWCEDGRVPRLGSLSADMPSRCACYSMTLAIQYGNILSVPDDCEFRSSSCPVPP